MLKKIKNRPFFYLSLLACYASGLTYIAAFYGLILSSLIWPATFSAVFFGLLVLRTQPTLLKKID